MQPPEALVLRPEEGPRSSRNPCARQSSHSASLPDMFHESEADDLQVRSSHDKTDSMKTGIFKS